MSHERKSGILLPIASLPGPWGIGDIGFSARWFLQFLEHAGQQLWQILPLNPTGGLGSPYDCFSAFACSPLLISLEGLVLDGLLTEADLAEAADELDPVKVNYPAIMRYKGEQLGRAFSRFQAGRTPFLEEPYRAFCAEQDDWLSPYALFMALRRHFNDQPWTKWPEEAAGGPTDYWYQALEQEWHYHCFTQFLFFHQWQALKQSAARRNIAIIGDLPIFVSHDSADVWANRHLFDLDERGHPAVVAGVPPDYFSSTGQLWGNPLYAWDEHRRDHYAWWTRRLGCLLQLVDQVRIDHFRGFASYWAVPAGSKTAQKGRWQPGPGKELFSAAAEQLGPLPVIAEDLGLITDDVHRLRDELGFPGMRVLQFAFDGLAPNMHSPHEYHRHCVAYSGTHDNDTSNGWFSGSDAKVQAYCRRYLHSLEDADMAWEFIRSVISSVAGTAVIPLQDVLGLGSEARLNTPGTIDDNWSWRVDPADVTRERAKRLEELTTLYGRG